MNWGYGGMLNAYPWIEELFYMVHRNAISGKTKDSAIFEVKHDLRWCHVRDNHQDSILDLLDRWHDAVTDNNQLLRESIQQPMSCPICGSIEVGDRCSWCRKDIVA